MAIGAVGRERVQLEEGFAHRGGETQNSVCMQMQVWLEEELERGCTSRDMQEFVSCMRALIR